MPQFQWPEWDPAAIALPLGGVLLVGLYCLWTISRKIVRWGYFAFYFLIGALLSAVFVPVSDQVGVAAYVVPFIGGFVFASVVMAIRAKVFRFVAGLMVLVIVNVLGGAASELGALRDLLPK